MVQSISLPPNARARARTTKRFRYKQRWRKNQRFYEAIKRRIRRRIRRSDARDDGQFRYMSPAQRRGRKKCKTGAESERGNKKRKQEAEAEENPAQSKLGKCELEPGFLNEPQSRFAVLLRIPLVDSSVIRCISRAIGCSQVRKCSQATVHNCAARDFI